jgi:selenocysteine-specific elongation factor
MPRDLILGTAGHIDHGKTSLVKVLTGIDTDRLPEEKARGITIDIGFANLTIGDDRLGIVDVPGHERFVKNMLAGATGIDLAVLIVAADDSVMPQTREHLDILKLLGLRHGVIALTKADLVDQTTREVAELEVRELVKGSFLENAQIIPTSTVTGIGIPELKQAIAALCQSISPSVGQGSALGVQPFRLPIDRSFTVAGHGTIVTGSIVSGVVKIGDELDWHKGDGTKELVRVRSLNNHGKATEELHRGQRGALNLAGVPHDAVRRGQELTRPGYLDPSKVLTVRLHALVSNRKPIKHRLPCRLHVGTAEVMATVSVLDADTVEPGQWAITQLFLDEPVTAVWGQPFVLRDSSAEHTLGGGQILQPCGTKIRRQQLEPLEKAEQLWSLDPLIRSTASAWFAGFTGFPPAHLIRDVGIDSGQTDAVVAALVSSGDVVELVLPPNRKLLVHTERVNELGSRLLTALGALHEQHPLMTNHDRQKVIARLEYIGDEALMQAVTDRLIKQKKLVGDLKRIARADFKPKLSLNQRKLKDKIVDDHKKGGFTPPEPASFANQAAGNASALKDIFEVACAEGFLVRVTDDIFLHTDVDADMRKKLAEKMATVPGLTVAEIRDLLGTTRKFAIPICEYLDRTGVTKRNGDLRTLISVQ